MIASNLLICRRGPTHPALPSRVSAIRLQRNRTPSDSVVGAQPTYAAAELPSAVGVLPTIFQSVRERVAALRPSTISTLVCRTADERCRERRLWVEGV